MKSSPLSRVAAVLCFVLFFISASASVPDSENSRRPESIRKGVVELTAGPVAEKESYAPGDAVAFKVELKNHGRGAGRFEARVEIFDPNGTEVYSSARAEGKPGRWVSVKARSGAVVAYTLMAQSTPGDYTARVRVRSVYRRNWQIKSDQTFLFRVAADPNAPSEMPTTPVPPSEPLVRIVRIEAIPQGEPSRGSAVYRYRIVDEAGQPVSGAMLRVNTPGDVRVSPAAELATGPDGMTVPVTFGFDPAVGLISDIEITSGDARVQDPVEVRIAPAPPLGELLEVTEVELLPPDHPREVVLRARNTGREPVALHELGAWEIELVVIDPSGARAAHPLEAPAAGQLAPGSSTEVRFSIPAGATEMKQSGTWRFEVAYSSNGLAPDADGSRVMTAPFTIDVAPRVEVAPPEVVSPPEEEPSPLAPSASPPSPNAQIDEPKSEASLLDDRVAAERALNAYEA